jgi:hypothetical protein
MHPFRSYLIRYLRKTCLLSNYFDHTVRCRWENVLSTFWEFWSVKVQPFFTNKRILNNFLQFFFSKRRKKSLDWNIRTLFYLMFTARMHNCEWILRNNNVCLCCTMFYAIHAFHAPLFHYCFIYFIIFYIFCVYFRFSCNFFTRATVFVCLSTPHKATWVCKFMPTSFFYSHSHILFLSFAFYNVTPNDNVVNEFSHNINEEENEMQCVLIFLFFFYSFIETFILNIDIFIYLFIFMPNKHYNYHRKRTLQQKH